MATENKNANYAINWEIGILSDHPAPTQNQNLVALELFGVDGSLTRVLLYQNEAKRLGENLADGKPHPKR